MMTFQINGASRIVDVDSDVPLLWVLRDELGMTGTKYGCGVAQCGACTVHIDGRATRSCVTPAAALRGRDVLTIESYTGLATILAEELDADWSQIRVEAAPADAERYNNLKWGPVQGTGGSSAMANSWEQHRRAGATARATLVEAAAREWGVPASEITVERGVVAHPPSGRRATFGELAPKAAKLTPPAQVKLKDPSQFTLVGKRVPRIDGAAKTDGSAKFTMDFSLPGMLTAVIARAPRFGATVKSFDATATRRVKGVTHVVQVPSGVAVVATKFWAARKGREALRVTWDESRAESRGSEDLFTAYRIL